ncbi:hypothetical protein ACFQ2K_06125 [Streptomyces sanglieri]|uniref:Solute-binding protein family 3/N-terminal domain-containing protein n=1 Tax=Streptomyces sanglieri TaxID=193460 RepID=A0ABW2WRL2_9ACTN
MPIQVFLVTIMCWSDWTAKQMIPFPNPQMGKFLGLQPGGGRGVLKEANIESRPIRVDVQSSEQLLSLKNRAVDLNAALAMTSTRMEEVEFVGPIASGALGVLVQAKDAKSIRVIDDLHGKSVCTPEGSTVAQIMESEAYARIPVVKMPDSRSCIEALEKMEVVAVAGDTLLLSTVELEKGSQLRVVPNLTIGSPSQYGIALPKGHHKDCTRLRDGLLRYVSSGKWLKAFRDRLPNVGQHANELQPTADEIENLSCRG